MDVVHAETELMRALSPADIFADVWIGAAVVRIDDGVAPADVVAVSSTDRKARFGVGIVRSVHTQFGPGRETVGYFRNLLPGRADVEGTDKVGPEQIGAPDRQCVHTIGLTVPAQCEGIGRIE